ncbi:AraC family transcriptional regulator [Kiloniella laminariae]|uniref:AraC family transcriptional regulator n=1 Tax=Kiloniella laminariae TaxID=454162 RepID=UPI000368D582|nr:AraC family transcriptional regulator [Kiloniella laminariae]
MKAEFRSYDSEERRHSHSDFHQLILPGSGKLELEVETLSGLVGEDCAALISATDSHAYKGSGINSFTVVDLPVLQFQQDQTLANLWDQAHQKAFFPLDDRLHHLARYTSLELDKTGLGLAAEKAIRLLLLSLAETGKGPQKNLPEKLEKALAFIRQNHARKLASADIAAAACLSVSQLHNLFRTTLSLTPGEYQTQVRLERAKELINRSSRSLADIALAVGYPEQSSFNRAYRKFFAESPGQKRKDNRF